MNKHIGAAAAGAAAVAVGAALALPGVASADSTNVNVRLKADTDVVSTAPAEGGTEVTVTVPSSPSLPVVGTPTSICSTPFVYDGAIDQVTAQRLADSLLGTILNGDIPAAGDYSKIISHVKYPSISPGDGDYIIEPAPGLVSEFDISGVLSDLLGTEAVNVPTYSSPYTTAAISNLDDDDTAATVCVDSTQFFHDANVSVPGHVNVTLYTDGSGGGNTGGGTDYGIFTPSVDLYNTAADFLGNLFD